MMYVGMTTDGKEKNRDKYYSSRFDSINYLNIIFDLYLIGKWYR